MSDQVRELISNTIGAREYVRPVDIVMGDHWGEIDLSNSMRLSLLYSVLNKNDADGFAKGGGGGNKSRLRSPFSVARRSPQAMVKVVKKGGTSNARGMRDQMSYLSKDGDAKLERSERYFGIELNDKTHEDLIRSWGLSGETKTQSDKTTHFVVSFPNDTDHDAAYRAGRAWADEMFASGRYGDVFDYYTAFHTDRAHPHMHVVVNRRGMEHGDWLKVSLRSQFNYDEFRAVQVEVAAREGIYLEASHRLARGVTDRPIPDAEYRDAEREGRKPVAPSHTPETALKAAASVVLHVHQMGAAAAQLQDQYPELSMIISKTAETILVGHEVMPGNQQNNRPLNHDEINQASEFIMSRRTELLDGLKEIDDEIKSLPDGEARSRFERDASLMKADTAELMPDVAELQRHTFENLNGFYQGLKVEDEIEKEAKLNADGDVAELAKEAGLDPDKFVSRFETGEAASQELADTWRQDELEVIQKNLTYQDQTEPSNQSEVEQLAKTAYDELHRNALQTYRQAERELEAHRSRKKQLHRIAKLVNEGKQLGDDVDVNLNKLVKDTLHSNELRSLEAGNADALKHITIDVDQQHALSRKYLGTEIQGADGNRQIQLQSALEKVDQEAALALKQSRQRADKDRGLDL